jgi:hypothetical protein
MTATFRKSPKSSPFVKGDTENFSVWACRSKIPYGNNPLVPDIPCFKRAWQEYPKQEAFTSCGVNVSALKNPFCINLLFLKNKQEIPFGQSPTKKFRVSVKSRWSGTERRKTKDERKSRKDLPPPPRLFGSGTPPSPKEETFV